MRNVLVLSGHLHRPKQHSVAGIKLLTTAPASFGLPRGDQEIGWTLITWEADGRRRIEPQLESDDVSIKAKQNK